jgi:hypothetical protein
MKKHQRRIIDMFCGLNSNEPGLTDLSRVKALGPIVSRFINQSAQKNEQLGLVDSLWESIVGEPLAKVSRVLTITGETLRISAESLVIRQELIFMEKKILANLQRILPHICQIYIVLNS